MGESLPAPPKKAKVMKETATDDDSTTKTAEPVSFNIRISCVGTASVVRLCSWFQFM